MRQGEEFFNYTSHEFVRVGVAIPAVRVADPAYNADQTVALMRRAAEQHVSVLLFPELGLSSYTADDLFQQRALLDASEAALGAVLRASESLPLITAVGLPYQVDHLLYNLAVLVSRGRILGAVPKTYLPNYREFYERRQFTPGAIRLSDEIELCGQRGVPFGNRLLFRVQELPKCTLFLETCEDVWVPIPPSSYATLAGATVVLNLSASNITVAKSDYRHTLCATHSARCICAYLYSAAGPGESTTDLAWDGQGLIYENGELLGETERFKYEPQLVYSEIDLERISQERMRQTSFADSIRAEQERIRDFRTIPVSLELPRTGRLLLSREYERFPYVPSDPRVRDERCMEVFKIQVQGLAKRLQFTGIKQVVIGVSGGLDSTQALLVCAQAMDLLGLPRENIRGYTMPGFATSTRTREQAHALMRAIGCHAEELDIRPSARQMLADLGHPYARGEQVYDVTFENVQAGERTSHLFRLANYHNGLVVGTGDLSELALGWATYGVGDQMSHYNVNASLPKTLIQYVIRWVAATNQIGPQASDVLLRILETEISPELVPGDADSGPSQSTEAKIGPYELQDYNLYYTTRYGYAPSRTAFLSYCSWHDASVGTWPAVPPERRHEYDIGEIRRHLRTFLYRFFQISQFKRTAVPNAPKVGSGGSLSPRGDWRAPSDSEATAWLADLELVPERS